MNYDPGQQVEVLFGSNWVSGKFVQMLADEPVLEKSNLQRLIELEKRVAELETHFKGPKRERICERADT